MSPRLGLNDDIAAVLDSPPTKPALSTRLPASPPDDGIPALQLPPSLVSDSLNNGLNSPTSDDSFSSSLDAANIENDLFLSIDSSSRSIRACLINRQLEIVHVEMVSLDEELPEFGYGLLRNSATHNGVYTVGSQVRAPSAQRVAAVDLLLTKLALTLPEDSLLYRSNAFFLSNGFANALSEMDERPHDSLQEIMSSNKIFACHSPRTLQDVLHNDFVQLEQDDQVADGDSSASRAEIKGSLIEITEHVLLESTLMTSLLTSRRVAMRS
ncbi:hypothetical protein OIO90_000957 [Microbotryomycetes sp. JL221]|nr:hypothetical protein OIO90_000957 [Microbotryomycetes sp. JL221]